MNYRYLFFDLDGTLLPMDTDVFIDAYIEAIAKRMQAYLPPQKFISCLLAATEAMVRDNNSDRTNEEVFMADFFRRSGLPPEDILPVFENFYIEDFPSLASYTKPTPLARMALDQALSQGLEVVIATNPIFPNIAIKERLRWAGAGDFPFKLVTSYEKMHFCKPWREYYTEILKLLGAAPEECLMIGNDVEEDLVAAEVGIHTYLVKDYLINRTGRLFSSCYCGSLKDLLAFLRLKPEQSRRYPIP